MKNRRITARLGRTVGLGDFEFIRVDAEFSGDIVDSSDLSDHWKKDVDEGFKIVWHIVEEQVEAKLLEELTARQKSKKEVATPDGSGSRRRNRS